MPSTEAAARGVVFIHSCPRALLSHVEWAVQREAKPQRAVQWSAQPIQSGMSRCEITWTGPRGAGARIASALRGFPNLRFEVTEDAVGGLGERFCFTPTLGMFRAATSPTGDLLVAEDRLRAAMGQPDPGQALRDVLGEPWDDELEPFRMAADDRVRWLTRVG
ncbi:MAG: DUF3145 family protein [Candidatus Nanopelagicales bacterium]